jgi:hypothetical protein
MQPIANVPVPALRGTPGRSVGSASVARAASRAGGLVVVGDGGEHGAAGPGVGEVLDRNVGVATGGERGRCAGPSAASAFLSCTSSTLV